MSQSMHQMLLIETILKQYSFHLIIINREQCCVWNKDIFYEKICVQITTVFYQCCWKSREW